MNLWTRLELAQGATPTIRERGRHDSDTRVSTSGYTSIRLAVLTGILDHTPDT
jgi:hypothetical protein